MFKGLKFLFLLFGIFSNSQSIDTLAQNILKTYNIPEMAYAVIDKEGIIVRGVVGHHKITEIESASNASIDDYFHLGSNTKAITAFAAAYLVEQKKLSWDTQFFDVFPCLKEKSNKEYHTITLEQLLSHRAGVPPYTSGLEFAVLPKFTGNQHEKRKKFVEYILKYKPTSPVGEYAYSNAGYSVATRMLEKVSGKSWEELLQEVLKENLNLKYVLGWPNRNGDNQPYGHWIDNGMLVPVNPEEDYNLELAEPAGDVSMDIINYAKFVQLNIVGLAGEDNLLTSETYDYLHTSQDGYALGWSNFTENDLQISEHTGSDGTFFSYTQIDRKKGIGYVILINTATENAQKGVFKMVEILKNNLEKSTDKNSILQ